MKINYSNDWPHQKNCLQHEIASDPDANLVFTVTINYDISDLVDPSRVANPVNFRPDPY